MKFAIDREELAKALCDRFPLGVPYTAYREDADAIIAALERAPQAQEEPSGAPAPAGLVWTKEKPKAEGWYWMLAPNAEPEIGEVVLGSGEWLYLPADGSPDNAKHIEDMPWATWAGPIPEPAAPEAGAPGTQGADPVRKVAVALYAQARANGKLYWQYRRSGDANPWPLIAKERRLAYWNAAGIARVVGAQPTQTQEGGS